MQMTQTYKNILKQNAPIAIVLIRDKVHSFAVLRKIRVWIQHSSWHKEHWRLVVNRLTQPTPR